jgi:hypothetical protein
LADEVTAMNQQRKTGPARTRPMPPAEPEIQQSDGRSIARDERLKRMVKHHPKRDEPKVDSVEPGETPAP